MLTKWGKKIIQYSGASMGIPKPAYNSDNNNIACITAKDIHGNTIYCGPYMGIDNYQLLTSLTDEGASASVGIAFGSGNTTPTDEDYTMESLITGISASTPSAVTVYDSESEKYSTYVQFAITNNTASTITISEVGRFLRIYPSDTYGTQAKTSVIYQKAVLADHLLLDTPVTISPNESGIVRYQVTYV